MTPALPREQPSPAATVARRRRVLVLAVAGLAALAAYLLLPADMGELGRRAVAIALFAAVLWATEAIPLFATSLAVVGLEVLLLASRDNGGGLARVGDLSFTRFFEPFASSTIILFLGGFLLAAAVTKHQLDRAVAGRLLRPFLGNSSRLVFAVILTTGLLSTVISNTATAAMMLAIIGPLIRAEGVPRRLASALALAVAFGASIGGFITPVSTPPNAITISHLRALGYEVSFLQWVLMAAPLSIGMLLVTGTLICAILRPPPFACAPPLDLPARLSWRGVFTAAVILAAIAAWLCGPLHGVADAAVAILAATVLAVTGVLDRRDVRSIDWDVLLLMWGGLALGNGLHLTGVLEYVGGLAILREAHGWVLAIMVIAGGMLFATFLSNTAAANVLVPLAIAISMSPAGGSAAAPGAHGAAGEIPLEAARLAVIAGLTVSFSVALPISTPSNVMAYSTGVVRAADMLRVGLLVSLIAVGVLMAGYFWVLPLVMRAV